ncbi:hypothetical protein FDP41_008196 [Naegleria fowleri]|uniref:Swiss Army Knife 2H phosphoesterase domain-containing protein n=1 Tax=Naegleria fowleri TaxID=5763 RepID=A0A6A5BFC0_NAEFO|nr:uncharacterized protein FDP41_008196 [Naegleria fowleri]KAF0973492.1 hypothetical protein FDP41_008196 [Naegleria fowleri]
MAPKHSSKIGKKTISSTLGQGELVFNGGYLGLSGEIVEIFCETFKPHIEKHVPKEYQKKKDDRDKSSHHHITLMLKEDVKKALEALPNVFPDFLPPNANAESLNIEHLLNVMAQNVNFSEIKCLGIGRQAKGSDETLFLVVEWPSANSFLQKVNATTRDFHITLGFKDKDIHGVAKNYTTLLK